MSAVIIPIALAGLYGIVMFQFSSWSLKRQLSRQSNPLLDKNLERIMAKFAKALEVDKIRINIFETEPINGLAAPDGRIFITRGFYNKYKNGDVTVEEISSVVAHELGHVALGHIRRRMIDFSGQTAIRVGLGFILGRLLPGIGYYIANALAQILSAKLSRSDEYAADAYAAALLQKSNIGLDPQISLLNKLDYLINSNEIYQIPWLMSHPSSKDRITEIQKLEKKWAKKIS